jgi:hypothetical protein
VTDRPADKFDIAAFEAYYDAQQLMRAYLTAFLRPNGRNSSVEVLRSLSAPTLDIALVNSTRGARRGGKKDSEAEIGVVIVVDEWLNVKVTVEEDSVRLEFAGWSERSAPLVVLLPQEDNAEGLLPSSIMSDAEGEFDVRFENVPLGSYLLSIAPANALS